MRAFPAGTDDDTIQAAVRAWAEATEPLRLELAGVSVFGPPFQIVVLVIRKTRELADAYRRLLDESLRAGLPDWPGTIAPEDWVFHLSLAYCADLDEQEWKRAEALARRLSPGGAQQLARQAELVAFDVCGERRVGSFALRKPRS
jgi:2'-5' RNA ligase